MTGKTVSQIDTLMNTSDPNVDKAGKDYWNTTERNQYTPTPVFDPKVAGIRNFGKRMWHKTFESVFGEYGGSGTKLLELGCGGSVLLPYFSRQFGFQISGLDYSDQGCQLARNLCQHNGVSAQIICADFFRAPRELLGAFDVVTSFGVVEHFTDTERTVAKFAGFLKAGGMLITTVPNMGGLVGFAQRILAKSVFEKHIVIERDSLCKAHLAAGLEVLRCEYLLFTNFGVVNLGPNSPLYKRACLGGLKAATGLAWTFESFFSPLPANPVSSPYIVCVARKIA